MDAQHILIIGGTGFLGQEIACLARALGHHVTSLARRGRPRGPWQPWHEGVRWTEGDFGARERWPDLVADQDVVIIAAGSIWHDSPPSPLCLVPEFAKACAAAGVARLVSISAAPSPLTPFGSLAFRQGLARSLQGQHPDCRILLMPPVYGTSRPLVALLAGAGRLLCAYRSAKEGVTGERWQIIAVERAAMACLRAALEPGLGPEIDAPTLVWLGDAAILQ